MGRRIRGKIRRRERVGLRRLHRFGAVFRQMYNLHDDIFDVDREPSPFMRLIAAAGAVRMEPIEGDDRAEELKSLRALWDEVKPELEATIAGWKR